MQVAPGRQDGRRAHQVPAGRRADVAAVQRMEDGVQLVVAGQQPVAGGELGQHGDGLTGGARRVDDRGGLGRRAADQGGQGVARDRRGAVAGLSHRGQQVDAGFGRGALPYRMQAVGDQGALQLGELVGHRRHLGRLGVGAGGPEVERRRLLGDQGCERTALGRLRRRRPPALDRRLQLDQALVEPGLGDGRGQIADQGRAAATPGERAFRRVVGGVEVEVGHSADQPLRPAVRRQADLLARHELQRPVGAEVEHRVGVEVLAQVAVEGAEGVGRREPALEQ